MNVGFFVMRRGYLKHFSSLIEEALARGFAVTLYCDHTERHTPRRGAKSYEFPHLEGLPSFRHGTPTRRAFTSVDELARMLAADQTAVLFAVAKTTVLEDLRAHPASAGVLLAQLQTVTDPRIVSDVALFDVIYGFAQSWVRISAEYMTRTGRLSAEAGERYAKDLAALFVPVGFAEAEQLTYLDRASARARLGLPETGPVVVLFPFPFVSLRHRGHFWVNHVFGHGRVRQWLNITLAGRREFLEYPRRGWNDRALVRAIRRFCDRHEALFVVKGREKNPIARYISRVADHVFYDDSYYPATILDVVLNADLAIHFYSVAMCEAVCAGVPSICVSPSPAELPAYGERMCVQDLATEADSLYNFPGATWSVPVGEFIERFGSAEWNDFRFDPDRRRAYLERFLAPEDLKIASRVFADLEGRLGAKA